MDNKIIEFLNKNHIAVLSVVLPDSSSHSASLHYSYSDSNNLVFYFSTKKSSRKCQGLLNGAIAKASVVIGFSEEEWLTLQLDGELKAIFDSQALTPAKEIHYAKHPASRKFENDPESVFLEFSPFWWRYTDFNTRPVTVLSSS